MPTKLVKKQTFAQQPRCLDGNPRWAGQWRARLGVPPQAPLLLELAAGKAEFAVGWAQLRPDAAVLAVDVKPNRLWDGAQQAAALALPNLWFLREDILLLDQLFAPGEVTGIWITFPDPYPKKRHARRRLTAPYYLQQYARVLAPLGSVQFKTDDAALFDFTLDTLAQHRLQARRLSRDLHHGPELDAETGIRTTYERKFLAEGKAIHYLEVQPQPLLADLPASADPTTV